MKHGELPLDIHLDFLYWLVRGEHSKSVLLFGFLCGTLPSCLKVMGWWWWVVVVVVVAYRILVSAQALSQLSLSY